MFVETVTFPAHATHCTKHQRCKCSLFNFLNPFIVCSLLFFSLISYAFEMFEFPYRPANGLKTLKILFGLLSKHFLQRCQVLLHRICCCFLETFPRHWQKLGLHTHIMAYFIKEVCCHVTNHVVAKTNKSTFLTWQGMLQIKMCPKKHIFLEDGLVDNHILFE